MGQLIIAFITAFALVMVAMPALIKVAKLKHLVDEPGEARKLHSRSIPTLGGIMIFAGTIIAYSLWFPSNSEAQLVADNMLDDLSEFKYLVATMFILFFLGLKDDIIGVSPSKKLLVHIVVGIILVFMADLRIASFDGIFGLYNLPYTSSIVISVFSYIVIVNAINLIDGVDGLAGGIGFIASVVFAWWFYRVDELPMAILAIALAGSLFGFLFFNFNPARIFMGDSGSLIIGLILYVLAIRMIEYPITAVPTPLNTISKPVLAMAIMCYPLIDTLRVFIYRAVRGRSPFSADKNHIHHKLLELGLNHKKTVVLLYGYTLFICFLAIYLPVESPTLSMLVVGGVAVLMAQSVFFFKHKAHK